MKIETLEQFLDELKKPRDKRQWIDAKTYRKFRSLYKLSEPVLSQTRSTKQLEARHEKSRRYKRW